MPNYTTNYNLVKPGPDDFYNVEDQNGNMDLIDTEMKKITDSVGNLPNLNTEQKNNLVVSINELKANIGNLTGLNTEIKTSLVASVNEILQKVNAHLANDVNHVKYGIATGTTNAYAVNLNPAPTSYVEGMALSVKININATGASTLNVNGLGAKGIKKSNGTDVTNLKANGIYTFRYDGVNFILQGEGGSGNAIASDLLSGKTASTDAGDITGTMPNHDGLTTPIQAGGTANGVYEDPDYLGQHSYIEFPSMLTGYVTPETIMKQRILGLIPDVIKAGTTIGNTMSGTFTADATAVAGDILSGKTAYNNGSKVTGSMANRGAYNITPGTTNKVIPAGYHNGTGVVYGDADLIASNIRSGKNIFGIVGNLIEGKRWASGSATSSGTKNFKTLSGDSYSMYILAQTGLDFTPGVIVLSEPSAGHNYTGYYTDSRIDNQRIYRHGKYSTTLSSNYTYPFLISDDFTGQFILPVSSGGVTFNWVAFE